jgi:hypothetical protein
LDRRFADQVEPAHRLGNAAKTGAVLIRPGLAEAGDAQHDDARIDGANGLVADAPLLERARTIIFNHHIGAFDQTLEDIGAFRLAEIEGDAAFVARHRLPPQRDAVHDRFELALAVAILGMLDLDHLGAEVGEQHRRERRRHHVAGVCARL